LGRHAGDLGLPGRRVRRCWIVVAGRPLSGQIRPGDTILRQQQVEHRGDDVIADSENRDATTQHRPRSVSRLEAGE
jgi:hypothetical protein